MTTSFPSGLDSLTNPTGSDKMDAVSHAAQHANLNDAMEAMQVKMGIDGSSVITSIEYMLKNVNSVDPGHQHSHSSITDIGTAALKNTGTSGNTIPLLDGASTFSGANIFSGSTSFTHASAPIVSAKLGPNSGQQHTLPAVTSDTIALLLAAQTIENKTLNASNNTISNLTLAMMAANVADTDITLAANSDTRVATQKATRTYIDNLITGLKFKVNVRVASTANVNIASAPSSIDSVSLSNGDRVLLKNQSTASQNGPYIWNGAGVAMTRTTDGDTGAELIAATFPVSEGTTNQDTWWTTTNDSITLGSTNIVFTQTGGGGTYTAGTGLSLSGNQFSIDTSITMDLTTAQVASNKTFTSPVLNGTASGTAIGTSGAKIPLLNGANTWASAQTFTTAPVFTDQSGSRTALGLGTAATVNTGTSGATIPLLNGANTWATTQTFTVAPVFTDASGSRTALGLGTAAIQNTGTSGANVPLLNGANTWGAVQTVAAAGTPFVINSTDSTSAKIALQNNGTTRGHIGASNSRRFIVGDNTGAELVSVDNSGHFRPDAASTRDIGLSGTPFRAVYADEAVLGGENVYPSAVTPGGRLSSITGFPIPTSNVSTGTIYYCPYVHNKVQLYDGTNSKWVIVSFTEKTIAVPATTATNYDVFGYLSGGTLALELLAWTNDTTRSASLGIQDGRLCKAGVPTRLYLGSIRTSGLSGQTADYYSARHIWNMYNQVPRPVFTVDTTATWVYTTVTWRASNNASTNRVQVLCGLDAVSTVDINGTAGAINSTATFRNCGVGIGVNNTNTPAYGVVQMNVGNQGQQRQTMRYCDYVKQGSNYYQLLEIGGGADSQTWYTGATLQGVYWC